MVQLSLLWVTNKKPCAQDSKNALADAKQNLKQIKSETSEVQAIVADLQRIRHNNHFADSFRRAFEAHG